MIPNKPCRCSALIKAIDAYIAKVDEDIENNLKEAGFVTPKKTVRHMKELEDELTKELEQDTKMILTTMKDYDDLDEFISDGWPELRDSDELVEKLTRTFNDKFSKAVPEYTTEYIKRIESDATISSIGLTHQTAAWIDSWSGKLAEIMKLSDNNTIERILRNGLQNGKSVADTAKKISESGVRDAGYRARHTATTEMLRAHSVAQQESFMQSPAVESKMWRHSGWRQYARENHMAIDGQVVKKDETFTLFGADGGLYTPMYPRDEGLPPGESINCGCIAEPIVNEYILGLSLEERNRLRDEAIKELNGNQDDEYQENGYAANSAIRNTGKEVYYDENASYAIKLDGYSDSVNEGLSKAAEDVAKSGSEDRYEHMRLVNLTTGDWTYHECNEEPDAVGIEFWKELDKNPEQQYAFVHNHNRDTILSEVDMQTLMGTPQIPIMIVVRNDGVSYVAERAGDILDNVYFDDLYQKEIEAINDRHKAGEITESQRSYEREMLIVDHVLRDFTKGMVEFDGREK